MSARSQGSWQQFRAAVEELQLNNVEVNGLSQEAEDDVRDTSALPRYQLLRLNLEKFGHAEFFAGAEPSGWRVTPPTLASVQIRDGWRGILVGARTPNVLQRVHEAAADHLEVSPLADCPDQIAIVNVPAKTLGSIAQKAGLIFQHNAPVAILTSLPRIDDSRLRQKTELPIGSDWIIDRFSISQNRWRPATREEALSSVLGLFRFSLHYRRLVLLCSDGRAFRISPQVAKYLLLFRRRRPILRYDALNLDLSMPASCRPPLLIERALILCTNAPPLYEPSTGLLHYSEIPPPVADLAAGLLRQEFQ
jgi:hypothetical protein